MQENKGQTTSVWMTTQAIPELHTMTMDQRVEVCIVGAGIAGLTTAYLLGRAGKKVVVLDDGPVGSGQTERTTAHLSNAIDDRYFEIERLHGQRGAQLAAESHTAAINRIELIAREEGIDCDFQRLDGFLFTPPGEKSDVLTRELEAAHRAGLSDVQMVSKAPLASFDTGPCLRFPQQGQFHPLKYLQGLARAIVRDGGQIFTGTHAEKMQGGNPACVETKQGPTVTADALIVATNTPVNDMVAMHSKQAPYMSYAIGALVPRGAVTHALYWDTLDPYHYIRLQPVPTSAGQPQHEVLIVGGEDHKTGQADDQVQRFDRLAAWAKERFPMMGEIAYRWSGQVMESMDGLAFIGPNPRDEKNVFIVTGDSGMGMTHGTIAGILLTDLILGRDNPWATLYDPSRKTLRAAGDFLSENLNVAKQYGDWFTGGDVASVDEISAGKGAVMRHGLSKVAVFRDDKGALHSCSAICPHLGCIVAWNDAEHTWDCPCHGSRFDRFGKVVNGPANSNLPPSEVPGGKKG